MVYKGHTVELLLDVGHLDVVGLEEVAAGGHIEEEVLDRNGGAVLGGDGLVGAHLAAFDKHERAGLALGGLGLEFHVGDGGDGGQCLTTEALGGDVKQVVGTPQLGGGVPLEAEPRILERHSLAVVDNLYQSPAGILDDELDVGGTGIDSVFQEFLDDRGRALHHLTGGYLVGHGIGQKFDDIHRSGFWLLAFNYWPFPKG